MGAAVPAGCETKSVSLLGLEDIFLSKWKILIDWSYSTWAQDNNFYFLQKIKKKKKQDDEMDGYCFVGYVPGISSILKDLAFSGEDDESNLSLTKHRDLMSFLEQPRSPLWESHLPVDLVLYSLQLHPSSPHIYILPPRPWLILICLCIYAIRRN